MPPAPAATVGAGTMRMTLPINWSGVRWATRLTALLIAAVFFAFVIGEPSGSLKAIRAREWIRMVFLPGAVAAMLHA